MIDSHQIKEIIETTARAQAVDVFIVGECDLYVSRAGVWPIFVPVSKWVADNSENDEIIDWLKRNLVDSGILAKNSAH